MVRPHSRLGRAFCACLTLDVSWLSSPPEPSPVIWRLGVKLRTNDFFMHGFDPQPSLADDERSAAVSPAPPKPTAASPQPQPQRDVDPHKSAWIAKLNAQREAKAKEAAPELLVLFGSATGTAQMVRGVRMPRMSLAVTACTTLPLPTSSRLPFQL